MMIRPDGRDLTFTRLLAAALAARKGGTSPAGRAELIAGCPGFPPEEVPEGVAEYFARTGMATTRKVLAEASALASSWLTAGVFTLTLQAKKSFSPSPPLAFAWGAKSCGGRTAAFVNSRKPQRIKPDDRWLAALRRMLDGLPPDRAVIGSLGNPQYELVCAAAAESGRFLVLVLDGPLPQMNAPQRAVKFFEEYAGLATAGRTLYLSPFPPGPVPSPKACGPIRDAWVMSLADEVYVVEVRSGGNMADLAGAALKAGTGVKVFRPEKFGRSAAGNKELLEAGAEPWRMPPGGGLKTKKRALDDCPDQVLTLPENDYLIHYTRAWPGPWPGQSRADYYSSLLRGDPDSGHGAFDSLRRILLEKKIRASARMVRGNEPVTSFTSVRPEDLDGLIRWNPALIRWTFEPYGLAIPREFLLQAGAEPVIYGSESDWENMPAARRYRFQLQRSGETEWFKEREWRLRGGLDLSGLDQRKMVALVPTAGEAGLISREFGCETALTSAPEKTRNGGAIRTRL